MTEHLITCRYCETELPDVGGQCLRCERDRDTGKPMVWVQARQLKVGDTFEKSGDVCTVVMALTYDRRLGYQWPDEDDTTYYLNTEPQNDEERDDWSDVCL